jgi:glycosyltransferase involved in cell wall biosynthesis
MIRTIADVIRGEGVASALRRTRERIGEALQGTFTSDATAAIVNVSATPVVPRLGGVPIQLLERLRAERTLRNVVLLEAGVETFAERVRASGAKAIHLEGTSEVPLPDLLRLIDDGVRVVVSLHDFSLAHDRERGRRLLRDAAAVVFPSRFLAEEYRRMFELPDLRAELIEPGVAPARALVTGTRRGIAFAGSVRQHKGAHLLAEIAGDEHCHVFGGGDVDLLRDLRRRGNFTIHGYYRAGTLPSLLARHGIGLVIIPSVVPETFSLVLSEAWQAGAVAAAFDHGAVAERIRRHGGGLLSPVRSGAAGLRDAITRWRAGNVDAAAPREIATPLEAATAHVTLYRRLGLLDAAAR